MLKLALKEYIKNAITSKHQAMPLFNRITPDGIFPIVNFHMSDDIVDSISSVLTRLVPFAVNRLYLVNNSMSEKNMTKLIAEIGKSKGLKGLVVINNSFGGTALKTLCDEILKNECFNRLNLLVLKDPQPAKPKPA